jgi:TolB-like protein/DNA-binding winged helix-turn-helix (wHTH) protein/Tfp pilus assembly protein PilF
MHEGQDIAFDGWVLRPMTGELLRDGACVRLQDRSLQILRLLLSRPGELVTREEVIAHLWPKAVVDYETGINTAMRKLRIALNDDPDAPRYIETVPRKGYRFICTIEPSAPLPRVEGTGERRALRGYRIAIATVIAMGLVVATITFYEWRASNTRAATPAAPRTAAVLPSAQTASRSASEAATAPARTLRLAVLPFENLSADKEQEFFSDGMTEEITSALAKVSGLTVVARTSAFEFKNTNKDIRSIGQALGATHLIEGSVRKAGETVRIGAKLIRADDGTYLWTESYDRELKDVFAVQEEIATAIAGALRVPLGLKERQSLVANRTADTESYQDYLRAKALVHARGALEPGGPVTQAAELLEQVVARDPNYAPAWALLAQASVVSPFFTAAFYNGSTDELRQMVAETLTKAESATAQAIRLDPNHADGYTALAQVRRLSGRLVEADDLFKQALSVDAGNSEALHWYSSHLANVGRLNEAVPLRRRLQALEPFYPIFQRSTAQILWAHGQSEEAIAILKTTSSNLISPLLLVEVYVSMGRNAEAAQTLQGYPSGIFPPGVVEEAVRLLRSAPVPAPTHPTVLSKGRLGFVYLYVGAPDRAIDFFESTADAGMLNNSVSGTSLWAPAYAPVRKTARFKNLVRTMGLVDYWRVRGWPEFCHPTTGNDFVCT